MAEERGLNMVKLQSSIRWKGMVRLHQLKEDDESMLSETEYPKGSGKVYYACASTGLLFDKKTGRCLQSSQVELLLGSVVDSPMKSAAFARWVGNRQRVAHNPMRGKPGPKPKGSQSFDDDNETDED